MRSLHSTIADPRVRRIASTPTVFVRARAFIGLRTIDVGLLLRRVSVRIERLSVRVVDRGIVWFTGAPIVGTRGDA